MTNPATDPLSWISADPSEPLDNTSGMLCTVSLIFLSAGGVPSTAPLVRVVVGSGRVVCAEGRLSQDQLGTWVTLRSSAPLRRNTGAFMGGVRVQFLDPGSGGAYTPHGDLRIGVDAVGLAYSATDPVTVDDEVCMDGSSANTKRGLQAGGGSGRHQRREEARHGRVDRVEATFATVYRNASRPSGRGKIQLW